jgi:Spy/CpxP family protein refolding chaperone
MSGFAHVAFFTILPVLEESYLQDRKGRISMKEKQADIIAILAVVGLAAAGLTANFVGKNPQTGEDQGSAAERNVIPGRGKGQGPLEALNMTPEQRTEVAELGDSATQEKNRVVMEQMQTKTRELNAAIAKPGATRTDVNGLIKEIGALQAQMLSQNVERLFAMKKILTPEQFAKMTEMQMQMMQGMGKRRMPEMSKEQRKTQPEYRGEKNREPDQE